MNKVILIYGKRGSGKSTLAKRIVANFSRVVVFDPLSEYQGEMIISSVEEFAEIMKEKADEESFTIVCRFLYDSIAETNLAYETASKIVWDIGNLLLVIEETEMFLDSFNKESFINYLISFGRHRGVSLLGIGRRPSEIAVKFRAQFTTVFTFQQTEPRDIFYLEQIGFDPEEIASLEQFEFAQIGDELEEINEASYAKIDVL